jgi:hypothetical protein
MDGELIKQDGFNHRKELEKDKTNQINICGLNGFPTNDHREEKIGRRKKRTHEKKQKYERKKE